ncbi:MAG: hypothetical protein JW940_28150 [Polyangiaceae bacterium]|nr:hypothetical protein [Polyangiaceae bacterium]
MALQWTRSGATGVAAEVGVEDGTAVGAGEVPTGSEVGAVGEAAAGDADDMARGSALCRSHAVKLSQITPNVSQERGNIPTRYNGTQAPHA